MTSHKFSIYMLVKMRLVAANVVKFLFHDSIRRNLGCHWHKQRSLYTHYWYQCFSNFSLKGKPRQQFWLLTEPIGVA